MRAMAIAFFYAVATGAGGFAGPAIYGALIGTGDPTALTWGFIGTAALMGAAGVVEILLGVDAEQESLESVATPLSASESPSESRPTGDGRERGRQEPGRAARAPRAPRAIWCSYPGASAPVAG
jgi:hypothetical protein